MTNITSIPAWTLGDRLAKARESAGIGVQEIAKTLGVSRTSIANYEHDRIEPPLSVVLGYANLTGVPISWLAGIYPGAVTVTDTYLSELKSAA